MERPFYDVEEDRTNLVPGLQQDAPWVQVPDASAGVESIHPCNPFFSELGHGLSGTIYGLASPPRGHWAYGYPNAIGPNAIGPNAIGPNAIYDVHHSYCAVDSNIMSLGYPGIHSTPSNQGRGPDLASHRYLASTTEDFTPLDDYGATDPAYDTASAAYGITTAAYGTTSAAYGTISAACGTTSAAYGAGTNTYDLTKGIWPSTDPVSTSMSYNHGDANITPGIYPPVPNPTLAPGPITTVQAGSESGVTNTDGCRPRCSTCNTTFKRASDLARHQKKHQPDRPFKCLVPGCNFKGAYRKDKLDAHVESCHRRGAA